MGTALKLLLCVVAAAATGCPGSLDTDEFADCPPGFVEGAIFEATCAGCHSTQVPTAGLDLEAPDIGARLLDVAGSAACAQALLIDSANPSASLLLDKTSDSPSCGEQMPPSGLLSQRETTCLRLWIEDLAAGN